MSNKGRSRRRIEERYSDMDVAAYMPVSDSETSDIDNNLGISTCDLIQNNYKRTGKYGARVAGRAEDSRGRGHERRHSPSISSPYYRNSDYDNSRGVPRLHKEDRPKQLSKKIKRQRHQKRMDDITSYPVDFQQERSVAIDHLSSRELISEIVKRLIRLGGTVSMDELKDSVHSDYLFREVEIWSGDSTLEGFLKENKEVFSVRELGGGPWPNMGRRPFRDKALEEVDTTVTYIFNLELCRVNGTKAGSCMGTCKNLHVCKFHIMSKCQSMGCKYGHDEDVEHNEVVLRHHFLDRLTHKEVKHQLRSLHNRRGITVPDICTWYNAKGCTKTNQCTFLHVCRYYILDKCDYTSRCKRSHNLSDPHTRDILASFGLDGISDQRVKEFLKKTQAEPKVRKRSCENINTIDGSACARWVMRGEGHQDNNLLQPQSRRLEEMYRAYQAAGQQTVIIKGKSVHVNFAEMTARLEGSQRGLELMRLPN